MSDMPTPTESFTSTSTTWDELLSAQQEALKAFLYPTVFNDKGELDGDVEPYVYQILNALEKMKGILRDHQSIEPLLAEYRRLDEKINQDSSTDARVDPLDIIHLRADERQLDFRSTTEKASA